MATTEILLLKPIDGLGAEGDQVKVRAGFARNYLLPQKIALPISRANRKQIEALRKARSEREIREKSDAEAVAERLNALSVAFPVKTGEGGKMFGSVTQLDLHRRLEEEGFKLERKKIHLEAIKELGRHSAEIKLHPEVTVTLSFDVVSENPIEETASEETEDGADSEEKVASKA
ncbi:MAG: 50S ribosomal protein L9 [Opitutales bacterium]